MKDLENAIRIKRNILIVLLIICVLLGAFIVVLNEFTITNVYVQGNKHYSASQIRHIVENGWFGDNSIILSLKYRHKAFDNLPFVETMDVKVENRNTVRVIVYEKAVAGYIRYLDRYMYFDKDGIVVENSDIATAGVPLVTGLEFDHLTMYESLPVKNKGVFQTILDVTKILSKYEISVDRIYFNDNFEMTLYFGDVRIQMGGSELLEEKMQQIDAILPSLKGKSGVLDLSNYQSTSTTFSFQEDEQ